MGPLRPFSFQKGLPQITFRSSFFISFAGVEKTTQRREKRKRRVYIYNKTSFSGRRAHTHKVLNWEKEEEEELLCAPCSMARHPFHFSRAFMSLSVGNLLIEFIPPEKFQLSFFSRGNRSKLQAISSYASEVVIEFPFFFSSPNLVLNLSIFMSKIIEDPRHLIHITTSILAGRQRTTFRN